jgi:predicted nucleic acid-binding protein
VRAGYLLDTDWIIDHLNGVAAVSARLKELEPAGLAVSITSLAELHEGVHYSRDPIRSETLQQLPSLSILPIDDEVCRIFGRERGRLRQQGPTIGDFDLLIAATCLRHRLQICTHNRRHFEGAEGLLILLGDISAEDLRSAESPRRHRSSPLSTSPGLSEAEDRRQSSSWPASNGSPTRNLTCPRGLVSASA